MAALATVDQLEERLGRALNGAETVRAAALLEDASAAVRGYTGQQFTAGSSTVRLRPRRGTVRLPQRPVTGVSSVEDDNGNDVLFTWVSGETVKVASNVPDTWSFVPWVNGYEWLTVEYDHGYETVPDDIVGVVCQIVARSLGRPGDQAGLTQESIDGYSVSYGTAAGSGPLGMLPDERAVLDRYRRVGSLITTGP